MTNADLEILLVDQNKVDTARLSEAIRGSVGIDSTSGEVVLADGFGMLSAKNKLLVVLLGRLASTLLGRRQDDRASVADLTALTGMPAGTVGPAIRKLKTDRLVDQDPDKRYFVPRVKVIAACDAAKEGRR